MGISVGLVGLGSFGSAFAELFNAHPLVDRVALCDRVPERVAEFARRESFRKKLRPADTFATLDELLKTDIDAVVIITQHWLHAKQAVQALQAGKHVYSAVPLMCVPDGDEILEWCDKLIGAVQRTGLRYMYGETTCYRPQTMFCRRKAREGAFGHFVYAEGEYFHDVDHGLRQVRDNRMGTVAGREYAAELAARYGSRAAAGPMHYPTHSTAGPIWVTNAHMTKVCAWGQPARVHLDFYGKADFANETGFFLMSNGATCRIAEWREIGFPGREIFRLYGTHGTFEHDTWYDKKAGTKLSVEEMREPLPDDVLTSFAAVSGESKLYGGHGGSHAWLAHEFVDAVAHDRTPAVSAWDAVRFTAAGVMAHKSALKGGELLDVPDWGDAPG
ncbi:MAG: Gfo/Idh/MocA family oxidoreductase [Phycisphaerae bacterium]|nr:Gfo/Idh/MocA family oxidoreductase [Phycisphaerae bacterium]